MPSIYILILLYRVSPWPSWTQHWLRFFFFGKGVALRIFFFEFVDGVGFEVRAEA